jgi:hypothetical protein
MISQTSTKLIPLYSNKKTFHNGSFKPQLPTRTISKLKLNKEATHSNLGGQNHVLQIINFCSIKRILDHGLHAVLLEDDDAEDLAVRAADSVHHILQEKRNNPNS